MPSVFACIAVRREERRLCSEQRVRGRRERAGWKAGQRPVNLPPENWSIALQQFMPPAALKNTGSPWQYGAVRVTTRCGGSVSILTGYTTSGRFRHDASSYLHGSVPTNIPRLLLSFSLAPPPSAFRSYTRSHLLSFPSHSYLLHPRLFPRRCLLYSARFRGCVME